MPVFRFICRAQPTTNNPKFSTWQPADVIGFIKADEGPSAQADFLRFLTDLHWKVLEWRVRDQLIEERVQEVGGGVWEAYQMAVRRGRWYKIVPEHFMADTLARTPLSPPRPNEAFVDRIIMRAGGRRPTAEERAFDAEQNADYFLDDFVLELKDLQEERLEKTECHEKIAELFWPYFEDAAVVPIDPRVLNANDWGQYVDILGTPVKKRVAKATQQVKATIERQKIVGWKGGVILMNTGFASLDHDVLEQVAADSVRNHSMIDLIICITAKAHTNGFDWVVNWQFSPKEPRTDTGRKLFEAYDRELSDLMTNWGRGGFHTPDNHQPLLEPVSFEYGGKTFTWDPGSIPSSLFPKKDSDGEN